MQRSKRFWSRSIALGAPALLLLAGCAEPTHEERVAQIRSKYEATLNGFVVEQAPTEETAPDAEGEPTSGEEGAEEAAAQGDTTDGEMPADDATEEGAGEPADDAVPLRQDVLLDIVVRHDSAEKLPGITVDITMADGERELETWRVWFDTSDLEKGPGIQYTHTLEDVDYEPGYGFSAEIRHPVPPQDRGLYQEFAATGG